MLLFTLVGNKGPVEVVSEVVDHDIVVHGGLVLECFYVLLSTQLIALRDILFVDDPNA